MGRYSVNDIKCTAIIPAAGNGTRMGLDINKQYIELYDGLSVLARTIKAFQECRLIDDIVLVVNESDIFYCKNNIVEFHEFSKVTQIVAGGATRQQSVFNGINSVKPNCDIVLIHDGARPFVSSDIIRESIITAVNFGASCVAVPVTDTIKSSSAEGFIGRTLNRHDLWSVQTPQVFKYKLIKEAYHQAFNDGYEGTDDSVLIERIGIPVKIVKGNYDNIKITTQNDLLISEAIIKKLLCN